MHRSFNFMMPYRRYTSILLVMAVGLALLFSSVLLLLLLNVRQMKAEYEDMLELSGAYQVKISETTVADGFQERADALSRLLENVSTIKEEGRDFRLLLDFLEQNHLDGVLVNTIAHDARKARATLEFYVADEVLANDYLSRMEDYEVFTQFVVVKRKSNVSGSGMLSFKVEIGF